jgi:hypothetical protein
MRAASVTANGQAPPELPVSAGTVAPWRRRGQPGEHPPHRPASEQSPYPPSHGETAANGYRAKAGAPIPGSPHVAAHAFPDARKAGLTAMIGIAENGMLLRPLPAVTPAAARPESQASLLTRAAGPAPAPARHVDAPPALDNDRIGVPVRPATISPGRLATRRAQASWRRKAVWHIRRLAQARALPLTVILLAQVGLSSRLVWSNTAFPDEALYLWSGRLEWEHWLHGTLIPNFPTYFSGAPVLYPPLGAMATALGGLAGGRILSLCFMLSATVFLHGVTRRLFDRRSAHFAAALFVGLAATQFLGAFATYDAMALMLLALATWLSLRAAGSRLAVQIPLLLAAASALALADAAKYAAALFDPVVILVAGLAAWRAGSRKAGIAAALAISWVLCLLLYVGIRLGGHTYWRGINYTTLARAHGTSSAAGIVADSFGWAALMIILALIGSAVAAAKQAQPATKLCACVLGGAVMLAPANQARIHVFTSLFKHVGFGAWFAAAVAGYALAALASAVPAVKKSGAVISSASVAAAGLLIGASLAQTHFVSWPDTASFVARLRTILPAHKGHVLAADNGNVIEFYLPDELDGMAFSGPWFLRYQDPDTGKYLVGGPAYADAIRHHYFSVIALSFDDSRAIDEIISKDIRTYGGYQLVATLPYRAAGLPSTFRIWAREGSG